MPRSIIRTFQRNIIEIANRNGVCLYQGTKIFEELPPREVARAILDIENEFGLNIIENICFCDLTIVGIGNIIRREIWKKHRIFGDKEYYSKVPDENGNVNYARVDTERIIEYFNTLVPVERLALMLHRYNSIHAPNNIASHSISSSTSSIRAFRYSPLFR